MQDKLWESIPHETRPREKENLDKIKVDSYYQRKKTQDEIDEEGLRSCHTKEFRTEHRDEGILGRMGGFLELEYKFTAPISASNSWTDKPTKTSIKHFYLTTWNTLIGTVGGTLGLFVGLSFLHSLE